MARRKSGLQGTAFEPPFYTSSVGSNAYTIPPKYETQLLDIYTHHTEEKPDIHLEEIPSLLIDGLNVPAEVVPNRDELTSWLIEGTEVLDFEKWLYNGYLWLLLGDNLDDVDLLWEDIWETLEKDINTEDKNLLRRKRLYLKDVKTLINIGKLDANAMEMLQTAGNGKVYIDYLDFFKLLGRLGVLQV